MPSLKLRGSIKRKKRAISPVIAVIVLVAVGIGVSVSIAFWMSGVAGQYTKFEKIEIQTAYSVKYQSQGWKVFLFLKNTGPKDATLNHVFLNERPLNSTGYGASDFPANASGDLVVTTIGSGGTTIVSGEESTVYIWIYNDGSNGFADLSAGTSVNIKVHSANGMDYMKIVELA